MADTSVPVEIGPNHWDKSDLGPLALGLSIGLQVMMTTFLALGSARDNPFADQLTPYATALIFPEYDLAIYFGGLLLMLVSGLGMVAWRRHLAQQMPAEQRLRFIRLSGWLDGGLAAASWFVFVAMLCSYWFSHLSDDPLDYAGRWEPSESWRMLVPAVMATVCAVWEMKFGCGRSTAPAGHWRKSIGKIGLVAFPTFVALVVAIPPARWARVAGEFLDHDRLHHVNFFALGPALAFAHGKALGTEIYSQYGIGWPLLMSRLSASSIGSYSAFVGVEVIGACLYYGALFFALWLVFRRTVWAAIGATLAISWQVFGGLGNDELIWQYPSSTMMRHPLDVGFFLALGLHLYSGRRAWIWLAGAISGLAIAFETETGLYLVAAFAFYWLLQFSSRFRNGRHSEARAQLVSLGAFHLGAAIVLLPLLLYASRGTLFTRAFFAGWLESLIQYGSWGVGAMTVASGPETAHIVFLVMTAVYMSAVSYAVLRSFEGRANEKDVLIAIISAYGLASLLLFVGRSLPYNLFHASVPFAVVSTMLLFRGSEALERRLPHASFAPVLCAGLVLLLLTNRNFLRYPSLIQSAFHDAPPPGLSLMSDPVDISGFPIEAEPVLNAFQATASAIGASAREGREVAVFDVDDTLFYHAADVVPWSRYPSLFRMILTRQSLEDLRRELVDRAPATVVMRDHPWPRKMRLDFVWEALHGDVRSRYELSQKIGEFEIWSRRAGSSAR